MTSLVLTKHHVFGNDFLVARDADVDGALARTLCDRHRGIGADGVIGCLPGRDGADVTMVLYNADGGRAEISGNGLACLAQAVGKPELVVSTDAGLRTVTLDSHRARVDMGSLALAPDSAGGGTSVDAGNPHVVLLDEGQDLVQLGTANADRNVELVRVIDRGRLAMRVHERGVGLTEACGSGACAAAAAARSWGLVGERVVVSQPGGDAEVELVGERAFLTVPVDYVARIEAPCP